MSEMSAEFAVDWIAALADMPDLRADQTVAVKTQGGGKYEYSFADLRQVLNLIRPILHRHHMGVHQEVHTSELGPVVRTVVTHKSGEQMELGGLTMPASNQAQAIGSAITYGRRYSLTAGLGLAVEDDDGSGAGQQPGERGDRGGSVAPPTATAAPALLFSETDRLEDGGFPRVCPYCRGECAQKDGTGKAAGRKIWKCQNRACQGGEPKRDGGRWGWGSFHDDPWKVGGEIDDLIASAGQQVLVEQPVFNAAEYLKNAVEMFTEWSPQKRAGQGKAVMSELGLEHPLSEEQAHRVTGEMAKRYYADHPADEGAPF